MLFPYAIKKTKQTMLIRLYLVDDLVLPKTLATIGSLDALLLLPTTEQVVLNRLFALNGVFVLLPNGHLLRQSMVDDDNDPAANVGDHQTNAANVYQVGDFALRIDRSYWQDDEHYSLQVHPDHVFEQLVVDKYRLRPGANLALVVERLVGDPKPQNVYFEVTSSTSTTSSSSTTRTTSYINNNRNRNCRNVLTSMRDHINDDIATFLSTLMLC